MEIRCDAAGVRYGSDIGLCVWSLGLKLGPVFVAVAVAEVWQQSRELQSCIAKRWDSIAMRCKYVNYRVSLQNDGNSLRCDGSKIWLRHRVVCFVSGLKAGSCLCGRCCGWGSAAESRASELHCKTMGFHCDAMDIRKLQSFIAKRWKFIAM